MEVVESICLEANEPMFWLKPYLRLRFGPPDDSGGKSKLYISSFARAFETWEAERQSLAGNLMG